MPKATIVQVGVVIVAAVLMPHVAHAACVIKCIRGAEKLNVTTTCIFIERLPKPFGHPETLPQMCDRMWREMNVGPDKSCTRDWAPTRTCQQLGFEETVQ